MRTLEIQQDYAEAEVFAYLIESETLQGPAHGIASQVLVEGCLR
jgi:hypothetical protein